MHSLHSASTCSRSGLVEEPDPAETLAFVHRRFERFQKRFAEPDHVAARVRYPSAERNQFRQAAVALLRFRELSSRTAGIVDQSDDALTRYEKQEESDSEAGIEQLEAVVRHQEEVIDRQRRQEDGHERVACAAQPRDDGAGRDE